MPAYGVRGFLQMHPPTHVPLYTHGSLYIPAPPQPLLPTCVFLCSYVYLFPTLPVDTRSLLAFVHLLGLSARWPFSPQHPLPPQGGLPDLDIYLYNKPGGQGTGGKGTMQPLGPWRHRVWESLFPFCSWIGWGGAGPKVPELSFPFGFLPRGCLHHSSFCG